MVTIGIDSPWEIMPKSEFGALTIPAITGVVTFNTSAVNASWEFSTIHVHASGEGGRLAISDFLTMNECSGCGGDLLPTHGLCKDGNYGT